MRKAERSAFQIVSSTQKGCRTECAAAFCLLIRLSRLASLHDDALAGHLGGNGQADIRQHGGCDVGQAAALAQLHVAAHTTNVVPFVAVGCGDVKLREGGCLADIAPTMLPYIGLPVPAEMTGKSIIVE